MTVQYHGTLQMPRPLLTSSRRSTRRTRAKHHATRERKAPQRHTRSDNPMRGAAFLLLHVGAASAFQTSHSIDDALQYLGSLGFHRDTPVLDGVKYSIGAWGRKVRIEGESTSLKVPDDVSKKPAVTWDGGEPGPGGHKNKHVLLLVGPDEPSRKDPDGVAAGTRGPVILWMGLNCESDADSCYEGIRYEPPRPPPNSGQHRYIFLLFRQRPGKTPDMSTISKFLQMSSRDNWPLFEFTRTMEEFLEPAAVTFFYGSREGPDEALPSPPSPTPPPPHPVDEKPTLRMKTPRAVGASGLGPGWEGGKRPKHDEL